MIHTFSYTQYPKLLTRQLESSIWGYLIMSLKKPASLLLSLNLPF
jgi:hypothetical protein